MRTELFFFLRLIFHTFGLVMFLKKISIINFKNVEQTTLEFSSRVNCFVGQNGAGKTNLIDAIHYLSMGKGAFSMTDSQSVRHGSDFFVLDGEYSSANGKKEVVVCSFRKGQGKTLKRNGKEYEKLSDHVGLIPIVVVSPADSFLITDAADERRRYLNAFISQLDKAYLNSIVRYNRVLGERNQLLKMSANPDIMEILDAQLVEEGIKIHARRTELVERLAPLVADYYRELSDDREQVELVYHSELNDTPFDELLRLSSQKDHLCQFTTSGVHRDDMKMTIGGYPLRKYGSQGQQKSFLVALKLAQYTIVARDKEEKPILLLDDLFDKLDMSRVEKLLALVSRADFGQIFITDCNKVRLQSILDKSGEGYSLFGVDNGMVTK